MPATTSLQKTASLGGVRGRNHQEQCRPALAAILSARALPFLGVATRVKAGDDGDGVQLDAKEQGARKVAHKGAAHVTKHNRQLQGVVRDGLHREVKLTPEPSAEAGGLPLRTSPARR